MLILKRTDFVAVVLIVRRTEVGIFESVVSPSKDSSSVNRDSWHAASGSIILLLVSFHSKEHLKMAMPTNLWDMETGNCDGKG